MLLRWRGMLLGWLEFQWKIIKKNFLCLRIKMLLLKKCGRIRRILISLKVF